MRWETGRPQPDGGNNDSLGELQAEGIDKKDMLQGENKVFPLMKK